MTNTKLCYVFFALSWLPIYSTHIYIAHCRVQYIVYVYIYVVKPRSPIYCQIEKWEKFVVMSCFSQHNGFWTLKKFLLDVRLVKVSRVLLWCYWERKFLQSCLLYYIYTDQVDVREDGFGIFLALFIFVFDIRKYRLFSEIQ